MRTNKLATLLAAGALVAGAQHAEAASFIEGTIGIGAFGSHAEIDKSANTVDIVDDNLAVAGNAIVNLTSDDFNAFFGQAVLHADFTYSPLGVTPSNPLWQLVAGGLSFDLETISSIDEAGEGLVLAGTGTVKATGFLDTFGTWSFSADESGSVFNFSSTVSAVPDGGATAMLLGLGVLGMAGLRRKLS